ncbi:MAG: ABC transporter permease [Actinomycetota bacterium]|nr:ABC transporter permease [Actinomycetota bacterium]
MTDTATSAAASPVAHSATGTADFGPKAVRLPSAGKLLITQIRYQVRLLLSSGRAIAVGVGLPVILVVASKGKGTHPNVAGYAVFGLTITAWSTYGVRLVANREEGVLKRWRATPLPRWCYFLGRILATALVAVLAGAVTVAAALVFYGSHFGDGPSTQITVTAAFAIVAVLFLGAFAWAATATALTSVIPTVEAAFPTLVFIYFPVIIVSGVLFTNLSEPHWLSTFATYLPAQPLIDAVTRSVRHTSGAPFLPVRDVIVLACWAIGGLLGAIVLFRWEPHRPRQRRVARIAQ